MASARSWSSMDCWARMNWPTGCAGRSVVLTTSISPSHRMSLDHALGLFSLIALFAHQWMRQAAGVFRRQAAWYQKRHPTFADALALVRKELCAHATFYGS